jgi:hypothetical protein
MMSEAEKPFFSVDLKNRQFVFESVDELSKWIEGERQQFAWMTGGDWGQPFNNLRDLYTMSFNNLTSRVQELRSDANNAQRRQALTGAFNAFYGDARAFLSDDPIGKIAIDASKINQAAGVGALALLTGNGCILNFDTIRGMLHAVFLREGLTQRSVDLVSSTIESLNDKADQEFSRRDEALTKLSNETQAFLAESRATSQAHVDEVSAQAKALLENFTKEGNAVISSIQATEASYKEQMTLQAPVDYWGSKAANHRTDLGRSRTRLVCFACLAGSGLVIALLLLPLIAGLAAAGSQGPESTVIYLKYAAAGAILTTIVFWIGRVLLRIYLSDRHLLTDAEERVAMIKTYLALSSERKVESAERSLVLAPIFRSAADGIVKEEGPDASLAGIIARAIDVKSGGR